MRSACSLYALALTLMAVAIWAPLASAATAVTPGATPTPGEPSPTPTTDVQAASPPAPAPMSAAPIKPLSNELTLTTWAHPELEGPIYAQPSFHSRRIATVHLLTEDGFAEVYPLLSVFVEAEGQEWLRLRIPGRPNGRIGWAPRELLGPFHHTRWRIVVDLSSRRMSVYYAGALRRVFPVGVGTPSTPTPPGHFWIRERFKLSNPGSPYWPYALGTSDYSTLSEWPGGGVIGIHGPYGEPQKIPGDPSHGCIRMLAPDIAWLASRVTLGTPVDVVIH